MHRRTYLAGVLTALSGCASQQPSAPSTASDTPTATPSPTPELAPTKTPPGTTTPVDSDRTILDSNDPYRTTEGWVIRVSIFRVRRGIVEAGDPHDRLRVPPDRQFLQLGVETRGDEAPAPEELCLAASIDGDRPLDGCTAHLEAVPPRKLGFLQAVPVPLSFGGERAAVVWHRPDAQDISWRVSDTTLTALRRLPEFIVEEFSVPETAKDGETIEVGITVRNVGDRKDWFVAALGHSNVSGDTHLEIPYDAGEERTVPRDLTVRFSDADALTVRLDWGIDAIEKQITKA